MKSQPFFKKTKNQTVHPFFSSSHLPVQDALDDGQENPPSNIPSDNDESDDDEPKKTPLNHEVQKITTVEIEKMKEEGTFDFC